MASEGAALLLDVEMDGVHRAAQGELEDGRTRQLRRGGAGQRQRRLRR